MDRKQAVGDDGPGVEVRRGADDAGRGYGHPRCPHTHVVGEFALSKSHSLPMLLRRNTFGHFSVVRTEVGITGPDPQFGMRAMFAGR